jgi:hypothetical protein
MGPIDLIDPIDPLDGSVDPLDRLLSRVIDEALATYSLPNPQSESHLSARILAHIAATPAAPPATNIRLFPDSSRLWLPWAVALAAAAYLVVATLLYHPHPLTHPAPNLARRSPSPQPAPPGQSANASTHPYRHHRLSTQSKPSPTLLAAAPQLPKLDVFPTPQPLTSAEQSILDFLAHASAPERQSLVATRTQNRDANADPSIDSIHIAAIQIQPIPPPDQGAD